MSTKTLKFNTLGLNPTKSIERYEVIQNELLSGEILKDLTISGSLLSQNQFHHVTFVGCVFYAGALEENDFSNCTFEDCEFQFVSAKGNNFAGSKFSNCKWVSSHLERNNFSSCGLDTKTAHCISQGSNQLHNCFHDSFVACWSEVPVAKAA